MSFLKRKGGRILFFLCLIGISHILIPLREGQNFGPFFKWDLFAEVRTRSFCDIEFISGEKSYFLTDPVPQYIPSPKQSKKITLWNLASRLTGEENRETLENDFKVIQETLSEDDMRFVRACEIKRPLSEYILLPSIEKRTFCETFSL